MRIRLLFFVLLCKFVLLAQGDATHGLLETMQIQNERIQLLEQSFYNLLLFNWIVNTVLGLLFLYVLLVELEVWDTILFKFREKKLRFWRRK